MEGYRGMMRSTCDGDHNHVQRGAAETDNVGNRNKGEDEGHVRASLRAGIGFAECIFGAYTTEDANHE